MIKDFIEFIADHVLISLAWCFLFIALVYVIVLKWLSNFSEISCYDVIRLINTEGSVVIDVRNQNDFYQSHIIGSVHLYAEDIRVYGSRELFTFKGKSLILVCSNGIVSCSIARCLYKLGFSPIYVLAGGIASWKNESLPLVQGKK
ncbi:rhodanese-like domain-containing protein [Blochmannia endosymbiont of Polyrhachis (Hedomyrma) turneri]|uniref:rhodanese-like domain-containing protein n=1 Tax=Blochmannia endosymbiont of Polyrhachis (Hedomyrma) turneri TaxID=1505596 RepID=UPI00061A752A|nr:rhodanese-like domain-containing protein [Blochmannia endosymbiont of Polyrhachis (Hedomyrma) turneri]AKC60158.1 rhodanese domain protein [Blochmannia endosymbiont of Polyrhachis (Hedomyrma) turneri]